MAYPYPNYPTDSSHSGTGLYPGLTPAPYPGQPPVQYPGQPVSAYPGQPATQYPGQSVASYPGQSPYPGQPPAQYPGQPIASYPCQPAAQYPGQPPAQFAAYPYPSAPAQASQAPPPPYPGSVKTSYYIKSQQNGLVATVQGSKRNPTGIVVNKQLPGCSDNQLWYDDTTTGTVRSRYNDWCLDIEGECVVVKPHIPGSSTQLWERYGDFLRRRTFSNISVGVNGTQSGARLIVGPNSGGQHQLFDFLTAPTAGATVMVEPQPCRAAAQYAVYPTKTQSQTPARQNLFYIVSEMNCKVLDIRGANVTPGTSVIMWKKKAKAEPNQLWYFDSQGIIHSALNDFVMESIAGGEKIKMVSYNGDVRQQWTLDSNRIVNKAHECLDICGQSNSDGAELVSYQYKGTANQHWRIEYPSEKSSAVSVSSLSSAMGNMSVYNTTSKFYIVSEMNCKVLDISGASPVPGTKLIMWPKKGNLEFNQLWHFDSQGIIRSALNDFVMEPSADGAKIKMMPYNGNPRQQWTLEGNRIINKAHECLDISGESKKDGAELVSYKYKGSANQHWRLQYV